jgi:hypothetical protein
MSAPSAPNMIPKRVPARLPLAVATGSSLSGSFAEARSRRTQTTSNANVSVDAAGIAHAGRAGQKVKGKMHQKPPNIVRIAAPPTIPRIRALVSIESSQFAKPMENTKGRRLAPPALCRWRVPLTHPTKKRAVDSAASGDALAVAALQPWDGIAFSASVAAGRAVTPRHTWGNGRNQPLPPSSNFPSLHIVD